MAKHCLCYSAGERKGSLFFFAVGWQILRYCTICFPHQTDSDLFSQSYLRTLTTTSRKHFTYLSMNATVWIIANKCVWVIKVCSPCVPGYINVCQCFVGSFMLRKTICSVLHIRSFHDTIFTPWHSKSENDFLLDEKQQKYLPELLILQIQKSMSAIRDRMVFSCDTDTSRVWSFVFLLESEQVKSTALHHLLFIP